MPRRIQYKALVIVPPNGANFKETPQLDKWEPHLESPRSNWAVMKRFSAASRYPSFFSHITTIFPETIREDKWAPQYPNRIYSRPRNYAALSPSFSMGQVLANAFVKTLSDSVMNGAGRSATLSTLAAYFRSEADSIMNAASRTVTLAKGLARSMSDTILNAASRFATVTRTYGALRTASDSIMNAASRTATLTKGLSKPMADSFMNAASRLATVATVRGAIRTMSDSIMVAKGRFTTMKAFVNGLLIQFSNKFVKQNTTYSDKLTHQGTTFTDKYQKQNTDFENKFQ
jgi:hypothetical protein